MNILSHFLSSWKNYLVIGLSLSTLWFYAQYQSERVYTSALEANNLTLKTSISTQKTTISYLREQQNKINSNISEMAKSNNYLNKEMTKSLQEVNKLRAEANKNALENPYQAGNIATDSFNQRLRSITERNTSQDSTNSN